MIDEKKLIESLRASLNTGRDCFPVDLIVECIEEQPKIEKCAECSRRKFYQIGYENGLNVDNWIPVSSGHLPKHREDVLLQEDAEGEQLYVGHYNEYTKQFIWIEMPIKVVAWQPLPAKYKRN